jgi:YopX protein
MQQRTIKFRAWDKGNREIRTDVVVGRLGSQGYVESQAGNLFEGVLMQYTGLQDKNGRDIYEGDKLQVTSYLTSEISFSERDGAWFYGSRRLTRKVARDLEVIGNVFEAA